MSNQKIYYFIPKIVVWMMIYGTDDLGVYIAIACRAVPKTKGEILNSTARPRLGHEAIACT